MAQFEAVSLAEYLRTTYRPDCDYVDGLLVERNLGEENHSYLQGELLCHLANRKGEWNVQPYISQRLQVSASRFRIPDICVVLGGRATEQIFRTPPFLAIEILSKDDTMADMQERIDDYLAFGIEFVWVINPQNHKTWIYTSEHAVEVKDGILRAGHIEVPIDALFA